MTKIIRLMTLCAALVGTAAALPAQVNLSPGTLYITFSPVLESGADPEGFASSTWRMSWELPQTYILGAASLPVARASTGTLTIAGSTRLDGTYNITDQSDDFGFVPNTARNGSGTLIFAFTRFLADTTFSFAGVTVSDFGAEGPSVITTYPAVESMVLVEHFHGATISSTTGTRGVNSFAVDNGSDISRYTFSNVTVIPEPRVYAALAGLAALGLVVYQRRKTARCSSAANSAPGAKTS